jgi:NhaA family Na+:H+ antiporter
VTRGNPIAGATRALQRFVALESASTILLLAATLAALALANSPLRQAYEHALHLPLVLGVGAFRLELSLAHFVNDALMAIFFFVVGLEIKRELAVGELSSPARAALPIFGALGGMIVPAGIYAALHWDGPALHGWGIPMATDIAFALAGLRVFGARVPSGLVVFLLALAIADDIGAVGVIAIFYTDDVSLDWLFAAALGLALCRLLDRSGIRSYGVYALVGVGVWYATLQSGVHATIAGVALGLLTPARSQDAKLPAPVEVLEHALHKWVGFAILPIFALCNAGVTLDASRLGDPLAQRVAAAVALGLLIGKPVGITLFAWLAVRAGVAALPRGVGWPEVFGAGLLAGIGFTVALFIAALAFDDGGLQAGAKIGVLGASTVATVLGVALLSRVLSPVRQVHTPADTA